MNTGNGNWKWKSLSQDIEEKTLAYWRVSLAWNNQDVAPLPVGEAIVYCTDNLTYTNPERPVYRLTTRLLRELIRGEGSPNPEESKLLVFPYVAGIAAKSIH